MKFRTILSRIKSALSQILVLIAFFYISKYIIEKRVEIFDILRQTHPIYLVWAIVLTLVMLISMSTGWTLAVRSVGVKLSTNAGFIIFYRSSVYRYLPGSLWYLPGRGYFCRQEGISMAEFSASVGLELFYILSTAGFLGGFGLRLHLGPTGTIISGVSLFAILLLLLFPNILNLSFVNKYFTLIPSRRDHLQMLFTYLFVWIAFGLSITVFLAALNIPFYNGIFLVIAVNAAAWLIGFFSFIPLGLGARETAMVWMLGGVAPVEVILMMSLIQRVIEIVAEGGLWIIAVWLQNHLIFRKII